MKLIVILLTVLCSFTAEGWAQYSRGSDQLIPDTIIVGNFDGDDRMDSAQLWVPLMHNEMFGCKTCNTEIRFSNGLKTIFHENDVGYRLENVGDLNQNGLDDIAYCDSWYMGCRGTYEIYIMDKTGWTQIYGKEYIGCGDTRGLKARIKVLGNKKIRLEGDNIEGYPEFEIIELK